MTDHINLGLRDTTAGCSCCTTDISAATIPVSATPAVTAEVLVSGMTCGHCVASVTEELTSIEGVQRLTVDVHAGGASRVTHLQLDPDQHFRGEGRRGSGRILPGPSQA